MAEMTPEQMMEAQRQQCLFCKIISGEISSSRVYEDEEFLAVLDIRPATLGHVLVLPKEHVPLLPLLPQQQVHRLFALVARMAPKVKEALVCQSVSVFIASGAAAGQQAPHLIVHCIPRDPGDGLDALDLSQRTVQQADTLALVPFFQQATRQLLAHLNRADLLQMDTHQAEQRAPEPVPAMYEEVTEKDEPSRSPTFESSQEALHSVIMANEELKRLIIAEPALVEEYVAKSEKLKRLFEGVNIKALSLVLRRQEQGGERSAQSMSDGELFAFIDGNEGLRRWLLEHPEELAASIGQNPRLQAFLQGIDILGLAARYKMYRGEP